MVGEHGLGDRIVNVLLYLFVGLAALACLLPFVHVIAVSLSNRAAVSSYGVGLWPVGFNLVTNPVKSYPRPLTKSHKVVPAISACRRFWRQARADHGNAYW
jgi:ABC-type glycerol-3-phosphate transport system permease component